MRLIDRIETHLKRDQTNLSPEDKMAALLPMLDGLTARHQRHCEDYQRMVPAGEGAPSARWSDVPFLPVRLLKLLDLRSVASRDIIRVLNSSGTTGQVPSRVHLDKTTSAWQRRALSRIMKPVTGGRRLPMLILDAESSVRRKPMTARGAGIVGMMNFGRKYVFALDDDMTLNVERTGAFFAAHERSELLLFGFTFLVWQYLRECIETMANLDLSRAVLVHSGGWKKLTALAVDNETFKAEFRQRAGLTRVHNFYGMVEQVGSVFLECDQGLLHTSDFAEIVVRRPEDWSVADTGEQGIIQCLSVIPWSYPGHSLLTEDMGRVVHSDGCPCGQRGTAFRVEGRVPATELRGCSDVAKVPRRRHV